jgi:S-phase kinase-associated protein 1
MDNSKIITLVSSDGDKYQISEKAARRSQLIKGIIDDYPDDPEVPLHNVKSHILQKIIAYLEYYKDTEPKEIEKPLPSNNFNECVEAWDYQFIDLELDLIFEIILAANYMDIKPLMELASSKVASIIKGKSPEEIRKTFNIQNDFTPEEEAQIREENQWCMENL